MVDARASKGSYAEARKKVRTDSKAAYEHDKGNAKAMLQPRNSDSDASSSASQKPLRDVKCPYLLGGLCKKGKNCKMSHAFSSTDLARIPCKLERRRVSGVCVAGSSCIYHHDA